MCLNSCIYLLYTQLIGIRHKRRWTAIGKSIICGRSSTSTPFDQIVCASWWITTDSRQFDWWTPTGSKRSNVSWICEYNLLHCSLLIVDQNYLFMYKSRTKYIRCGIIDWVLLYKFEIRYYNWKKKHCAQLSIHWEK